MAAPFADGLRGARGLAGTLCIHFRRGRRGVERVPRDESLWQNRDYVMNYARDYSPPMGRRHARRVPVTQRGVKRHAGELAATQPRPPRPP